MAHTLIERILARGAGADSVSVGQIVVCDVDIAVLIDLQFAVDRLPDVVRVHDPDKVAIVLDHAVPAPSQRDAAAGSRARAFAKKHGVTKFFDVGNHGIVHQVIAEQGLAPPGSIVACTDSHTCAAGAFGAAGRGLGPAELLQIVCTGKTWYEVPPTFRYELHGSMPSAINGKDVFLHIAQAYGDAEGHALEFSGPGLATVGMADRRTIATQGVEVGADFTLFPADEVTRDYFRQLNGSCPEFLSADAGCTYASVRSIDLEQVRPMVGLPGTVVNNAVPVDEVRDQRIDQAFVGSCANGQLSDLEVVARVLRGRTVSPSVRMIVTPASQQVYLEALKLGYLEAIVSAGATVTNSTCGACFGYSMGVLAAGEICITASTRNFKGRMGSPDADVYMASPATVAASAIRGSITGAGEM